MVLDANFIINKEIPAHGITEAFITSSVLEEIKDRASQEYLSMHGFLVTERNPKDEYFKLVYRKNKGPSSLSQQHRHRSCCLDY